MNIVEIWSRGQRQCLLQRRHQWPSPFYGAHLLYCARPKGSIQKSLFSIQTRLCKCKIDYLYLLQNKNVKKRENGQTYQLSAIHLNFSELDYLTIILILLPCDQERIHKFKCLNESTITIIVRGVQYQCFPVKPTMILTQVQRWRFSLIHSLENYCRVDKGNRTRKGGLHYSPTERNPKIKYTRSRWTKKVLFFGCPNLFQLSRTAQQLTLSVGAT